MNKLKRVAILGITILIGVNSANSQTVEGYDLSGKKYNPIRTAVPFMMISPDSRAAGLGDAGVATSPDEASSYWNAAKFAFIENDLGLSLSYTPWLRQLVNDINLAYLNGHYRIDENQVIGGALRYFALGDITFTDDNGTETKNFSPNEFAISGFYSRKLSKAFSMSLAAKYIHSNLTGSITSTGGEETHPGNAYAFDLGMFYTKPIKIADYDSHMRFGANISNVGSKVAYSENAKNFLPMNLRLGGSLEMQIDEYNSIGIALDFNKLLVPTTDYVYDTANALYTAVYDSDIAVATALFQSFGDAPGVDGLSPFEEEIKEINTSIGLEYWYDKKLAFRAGYFHEPQVKGNRKYFTVGAGLRLNVFGIDVAYLLPTATNHPLDKTIRFSLLFNIDAIAQN